LPSRRSTERRKRRGNQPSALGGIFKFAFATFCVVLAVGTGYGVASGWKYVHDLPDLTMVERYEPIEAIQLLDRNDHLICVVEGDQDRRVVPLTQISLQMQQAMLAAEDHHFYEHHGINFVSIGRASIANLTKGHVVEGGSTITQQLVKNLFFTDAQRTMDRKVKEALMSWEIESRYSKEKILEMYLNQVFFGNNAYGIERAATKYFDCSAAELNLGQSAFLAGLVKAPSELGTVANRQAAFDRQHEIIDKMVEYGYITQAQANVAKAKKLVFRKGSNPLQKYPYYVTAVLEQLRSHMSQSEMRQQGLRVFTNLDPQVQDAAEKVLNDDLKKAPKGVSQAALVTVNVPDGAVLALVGGVGNFWQHQFNRATNPHTAGSSFKPFVYLTALLQNKLAQDSMVDDKPLVIHQPYGLPDYAPKNFDHKFYGRIPLRKALALSRNVVSVRIAQLVGIDSVVETARQAGITTKLEPNLSLALGSSAVTPLEMAGAYATFSRMGIAIKPQMIRQIQNNRGQVIEVFESKADKVFPVEPVARLVDMMQDTVRYGTGTQAKLADRPVAGKTGTADAAKDIWFVGYTPDMCTAIWGGNDENLPIPGQHVTGGDVMAKIWRDYATQYYLVHPTPPGSFVAPTKSVPENTDQKTDTVLKDGQVAVYPPLTPTSPVVPESSVVKTNEPPPVAVPVGAGVVELHKQSAQEDKNGESIYAPASSSSIGSSGNIKEFKETKEYASSNSNSALTAPVNPVPAPARASAASDFIPATAPAAKIPTPLFAPAPSPRASGHNVSPLPVAPAAQQSSSTIMMNMTPVEPNLSSASHSAAPTGATARANRLYPVVQTSKFAPAYAPASTPSGAAQTP
jgi:penicillin-binding protein 1A